MTPDLPVWTPFDPEAPPTLAANGDGRGRVVALVAGAGAMKGGWVGEVALGLAASWGATTGGRVVAADASFREPCLHRAANVPLDEGLSDMLLWGGSLQRVARATERVGFVVTAGTAIADGAAALSSPRWSEVCEGFREAGVTLVVLVPVSEAGLPSVVDEASDVVLLLAPDEPPAGVLAEGRSKVRGAVGMSGVAAFDASPAARARAAPPSAHAGGADRGEDGIEGLDDPGDADDPLYRLSESPGTGRVIATAVAEPPRSPMGGRVLAALALVAILVLAVLAAAFFGLVNIPGITRGGPRGEGTASTQASPSARAPRQAFSVDVGTFVDGAAATERAAALAAALPDVVFISEPVAAGGVLQHRVLAGPVADSSAAAALVGRVAGALGTGAVSPQAIATPRAFQLGEMLDLDAARRRVEVLDGLEIPAYVLAVDYDDGSVRYRVYAGAYAEESEGVGLARLLQERGLSAAALSERIGRVPAADSSGTDS